MLGDKFDGQNDPVPDEDPRDQNGHGTHVAGIVGAKAASEKGVTGVAPGVKFVALKVFGPEGSTWDDIILEALEAAYKMKVDVINMSLGSAFQWPQYPTAQAIERLTNQGIFVAASAGNSGASGEFSAGAPAVGAGAVAVASFENDYLRKPAFLDPAGNPIAYDPMELTPPAPTAGQSPELVYTGLGKADTDFQNPDGTSKVKGKVALIQRGEVPFKTKSVLAQKYGATLAIIFNNAPGTFRGTMQDKGNYIPTVSISMDDGKHLLDLLLNGPVRLTYTNKEYDTLSPSHGLMSDFSSIGPAPDLTVKPDLTAPGGNIYSTFPVDQGSYATLSGTSMSSPHVAGAAALVIQGRREIAKNGGAYVKPTSIRNLLMNTATPQTEGPASDKLYPVHFQGAGLIDAWKAITARQRVVPDKLALGAMSAGGTFTDTLVIENYGKQAETYTFSALGADGKPAVDLAADPAQLRVGAGRTGHAEVRLTVPGGLPDQAIFSGWIAVTNSAGQKVAYIPYLGYKGNYQKASAFDPTFLGLPWLARLDGEWLRKSDKIEIHPNHEGADNQYAWIIYSLARQPQELRMEIWGVDAQGKVTGKKGNAFLVPYLGRSDGALEIFIWDGANDKSRKLEAGTYVLRLMALRPLGDPYNAAHWDMWVTGPIKVVWD